MNQSFMIKRLVTFTFLLISLLSTSQSDYFNTYRSAISQLPTSEKIDSIIKLPFEQMNSQPVNAIKLYYEGLDLAKKLNDNLRVGDCYYKLGISYYYKGEYEESVAYILNAISYFEKAKTPEKVGAAYATLGHQMKRRNLSKAFEYMRKGVSILKGEENENELSAAYNNFGVLHEMNNDLDSALYYYFKGLKIVDSIKDSLGIPYSLNNIGQVYLSIGKYAKAKPYFDNAFKIRKIREDQNGLAENYNYYGEFFFKQKLYDQAIENYLSSLKIAEEINYAWLAQTNAEQLAICYEQISNCEKALVFKKKSQEIKDQLLNEQSSNTIAKLEIQFDTERKEKEIIQKDARINKQLAEAKQRNIFIIGLSVAFVLLTLLAILIYRQQRYKQDRLKEEARLKETIAKEQTRNKLHQERLRISRDLHDNIGSQLTFLTSSMDNIKFISKEVKVNNKLTELSSFTRETITQLRDTIWAMNKENLTFEDLQGRVLNYIETAEKSFEDVSLEFETIDLSNQIVFSATQGVNLFRIIQESIHNALKYALASKITVRFELNLDVLSILISDNGVGFNQDYIKHGNGLKNMELRAKEIEADFHILSTSKNGTTVSIHLKKDKLNAV